MTDLRIVAAGFIGFVISMCFYISFAFGDLAMSSQSWEDQFQTLAKQYNRPRPYVLYLIKQESGKAGYDAGSVRVLSDNKIEVLTAPTPELKRYLLKAADQINSLEVLRVYAPPPAGAPRYANVSRVVPRVDPAFGYALRFKLQKTFGLLARDKADAKADKTRGFEEFVYNKKSGHWPMQEPPPGWKRPSAAMVRKQLMSHKMMLSEARRIMDGWSKQKIFLEGPPNPPADEIQFYTDQLHFVSVGIQWTGKGSLTDDAPVTVNLEDSETSENNK